MNSIAKHRAKFLAEQDKISFTDNGLGESVFFTSYLVLSRDYFLEATLAWILEEYDEFSLNQILCYNCKEIGFGVSNEQTTKFMLLKQFMIKFMVMNYDKK